MSWKRWVLSAAMIAGLGITFAPADAEGAARRYYYNTWKTTAGYCTTSGPFDGDDSCGSVVTGTLYAGRNYFYCQCEGDEWVDGEYSNHFWLYTDLDTPRGAKGWVSAVYVTVGGNDEQIKGLPICNWCQ